MALKLAVIVDEGAVQRFALDALDAIAGTDEITVFSCANTRTRKRWLRHAAYYGLNLLTVRNRLTRFVPVTAGKKAVVRRVDFESIYEGAWQALPAHVIEELRSGAFDVILKFGMGLLRVPPHEILPVPILSYHHGDPDRYRGRPAGFWEMAEGVPTMGQVVQVVGNRLDAGKVVAFAQTKVFHWSYRSTLMEAYRHSPLIINTAIRNAISGTYLPKQREGRNCRLPSNAAVIGFASRTASRSARHLLYGAFKEKAWRVSTAHLPHDQLDKLLLAGELPPSREWQTLPVAPGYTFYADPFFAKELPGILVEALRARSGLGEIVKIDGSGHRPLISERGHMSYPATASIGGRDLIIPETASWSEPRVYALEPQGARLLTTLRAEGASRVSDPTLFERDGRIYLFGNDPKLGSNALNLWSSDSIEAEFILHPASPIRISPEGSRMGGNIIDHQGRLFRLGQDYSHGYGDGLVILEINELNPRVYLERIVGHTRFTDRRGPHTLNVRDGEIVFDWYRDRFSLLAGFRRLAARLQRRRRPQATQ